MLFEVLLTAGAERDLAAIHDHVAATDGAVAAERLLKRLLEVAERLSEFPDRGTHPKELLALGLREYRQVSFRPYRVIYRIVERRVYISLIADGRRDMQGLLFRRLLGAE